MMEPEDKKMLAEWMGWTFNGYQFLGEMPNGGIHEMNWNPDTDHKQFAEVWNKLTEFQRHTVLGGFGTYYLAFNECLNNLPKVMEAVLTVIQKGNE